MALRHEIGIFSWDLFMFYLFVNILSISIIVLASKWHNEKLGGGYPAAISFFLGIIIGMNLSLNDEAGYTLVTFPPALFILVISALLTILISLTGNSYTSYLRVTLNLAVYSLAIWVAYEYIHRVSNILGWTGY
ncbi:MAG TPA: hypothetical protein HA257_08960 [Candidatus Methanoperedenaceae archaeon]|nr:hypothetical protein [Candidatus Methanoperedenaceae archaeon]